jgi:glycosyl-4,4'-diaponeurosporenoate acyltransferase
MIATIALDSLAWATISVAASTAGRALPDHLLERDTFVTRGRDIERNGRLYDNFAIRAWKDRVPEFGSFRGGRSKATLGGREQLEAFARETRRAEFVHWMILATTPLFALWNPPALTVAMVAFALVANVPFIAIQRYNRLRVTRVMAR